MGEKTKYIVMFALAGVLAISLFLNLKILGAKKAMEQELTYVKSENVSLNKKVEEGRKEKKTLEEKITTFTADLTKMTQERDDLQKQKEELQKQYEALMQEKEKLNEKLKAKVAFKDETTPSAAVPTQDKDSYWAGVLKAKTDLELQLKSIQTSKEQLERDKSSLELHLNNLTNEKKELEQQFTYHKKMFDDMAAESVRDKNERLQLQDKVVALKEENKQLRRQLTSLSNSKMKLEKKLVQINDEKLDFERRLAQMELFLNEKLASINEIKQQLDVIHGGGEATGPQTTKDSVELPPIVVRPPSDTLPYEDKVAIVSLPDTGSVISINKENNFVIVDLGEDAGIKVGERLYVYSPTEEEVGIVEVIQTRKTISACDIKEEQAPLQVGDKVRRAEAAPIRIESGVIP